MYVSLLKGLRYTQNTSKKISSFSYDAWRVLPPTFLDVYKSK